MKTALAVLIGLALSARAYADGISVQKSEGDVKVREGVAEVWNPVTAGDVLRPHDTMRTGADGRAVVAVRLDASGTTKRISLPPQVIVDMSDIRDLTQEELMLKIAMEKVRSSSDEWKKDGLHIPDAGVVHGGNRATGSPAAENDRQVGLMLMNGARVLFENGYYATTVLRAMEVFRMYPVLTGEFDHRLLLAQAMERANLRGEALAEYGAMTRMQQITPAQQEFLQGRMTTLRSERP